MRAVCLALGASVWLVAWAGQGGPPAARASGSAAAAIRLAKKQSAEEKKREQAKSQSLPPMPASGSVAKTNPTAQVKPSPVVAQTDPKTAVKPPQGVPVPAPQAVAKTNPPTSAKPSPAVAQTDPKTAVKPPQGVPAPAPQAVAKTNPPAPAKPSPAVAQTDPKTAVKPPQAIPVPSPQAVAKTNPPAPAKPSPAVAQTDSKTTVKPPQAIPVPVPQAVAKTNTPAPAKPSPAVAQTDPKTAAKSKVVAPVVAAAAGLAVVGAATQAGHPKPEGRPAPAPAQKSEPVASNPATSKAVEGAPVAKAAKAPPKRSKETVADTSAAVSGKQPMVVWKRGMSASAMAEPPAGPTGRVQVVGAGGEKNPALTAIASAANPVTQATHTREEILRSLATIKPGTERSAVFAKLGAPAYTIGSSDSGHYVERCRFRVSGENVASVEFRDGVVATVDRLAP